MRRAPDIIAEWETLGDRLAVGGERVFVVDAAATADEQGPPLLVVHGFPTSSIDFSEVLPALRHHRRVVLVDLPGYGLSDKPDRPYSLFAQADVVERIAGAVGLERVDLLTHDMGDTVGGELLARSLDGALGFVVERRVLTNGSVYIDKAKLTAGQQLLASLPDESFPPGTGPDTPGLTQALADTLAPGSAADLEQLRASAELVVRGEGNRLMPRLIRYLEERRRHEQRWTGAIESHPAELTVVWGDADPIAVWEMVEHLDQRCERRPRIHRLRDIGHYPMIEAPLEFADAVLDGLDREATVGE